MSLGISDAANRSLAAARCQALSLRWPYDVLEQDLARLLAGAAHLLILAVVVLTYPASRSIQAANEIRIRCEPKGS